MSTNHDSCVRVEPDDRRFVIYESKSTYKRKSDFFSDLAKRLQDACFIRDFAKMLRSKTLCVIVPNHICTPWDVWMQFHRKYNSLQWVMTANGVRRI
jgi:hypothetical protein